MISEMRELQSDPNAAREGICRAGSRHLGWDRAVIFQAALKILSGMFLVT
jgi:hypothetical protein